MIVQNFVTFCYWKSSKFMGKFEKTCIKLQYKMDNFVVHYRHTGCV